MLDAMIDASSGNAAVAVVSGDAGIGKSRLVREATVRARRAGSLVMVGRASATNDAPYSPLAEALLEADRRGELPAANELGAFRELIGLLLPDWRRGRVVDATPELVG